MGAGILPCAKVRGNLFFLFGKETTDGKWSDFGGSPEKNETIFQTAIREGTEELNGFLGNEDELEDIVNKIHWKWANCNNSIEKEILKTHIANNLNQTF